MFASRKAAPVFSSFCNRNFIGKNGLIWRTQTLLDATGTTYLRQQPDTRCRVVGLAKNILTCTCHDATRLPWELLCWLSTQHMIKTHNTTAKKKKRKKHTWYVHRYKINYFSRSIPLLLWLWKSPSLFLAIYLVPGTRFYYVDVLPLVSSTATTAHIN